MLRFDLSNLNGVGKGSNDQAVESIHIVSDYANLKNIQRELQNALDQMNNLHSQRFTKYIQ